jgi:hypothetical protein
MEAAIGDEIIVGSTEPGRVGTIATIVGFRTIDGLLAAVSSARAALPSCDDVQADLGRWCELAAGGRGTETRRREFGCWWPEGTPLARVISPGVEGTASLSPPRACV